MKVKIMSIAASLAGAAAAADLSNNLSRATGGAETAMATVNLAANFSTDASTHTLSAVILKLANPFPGAAELRLHAEGGLEPGALLATLQPPASYSAGAAETTFTASSVGLAANTTYWIVLHPLSGQFDWSWAAESSGLGAGFQGDWGVSDDAGATWWTHEVYPLQMRVLVDLCSADFNGDGFVDFFDYDAFVRCFESGACPDGRTADVNGDGFVDFFDYDGFVATFESGC